MILLIDNYDSFVHNLARYFEELGEETVVVRNDAIDLESAVALRPGQIVLSPGPCTPREAGICVDLTRLVGGRIPILGVCLGHQCLGEAFGGRVVRGRPVHGKVSAIEHEGVDLFSGLPAPLVVTRYHSLVVDPESLPPELVPLAWAPDGTLMALRHRTMPAWGVQFHPEAVLTTAGHALLANFLSLGRGQEPRGLATPLPPHETAPPGVSPPLD
ncbi:MAG: aminodeoxychorismate/anthranilate synthase component II [Gemmatimonadetes bacterium]|nr:aminodeoxychorismate/anthranilate synthase component II [Gemmatimonadota bacterium]